jgi:thioredoxin-dependent peroxiredoxin
VQVVGASVDKPAANGRWAEKYGLKMPLISDAGERAVTVAFEAAQPAVGVARRTTFLIEADGTLARIYPKVRAKGHAAQVLADCRELWG